MIFEFAAGWGWLLLAYTAGTAFGMWLKFYHVIDRTIDSLVDNGYLKHRRNSKGEIEILKINEEL